MSRPLMQHGVVQLEELFSRSKTDRATLKQLEEELRHRQTPRATALLEAVQTAMRKPVAATVTVPAASPQPFAPSPRQVPTAPAAAPASTDIAPPQGPTSPIAAKSQATTPPPLPQMSLDEAYKLLRSAPSSTWSAIEQSRRQLVESSSPSRTASLTSEQRDRILEGARRINSAHAVVFSMPAKVDSV